MKLTRRSLFATIGLLFTDPRKLMAKPTPKYWVVDKCPHPLQNRIAFINRSGSVMRVSCLCGETLGRNTPTEWDFRNHGKKIGDTITVRRPMRFTVKDGEKLS